MPATTSLPSPNTRGPQIDAKHPDYIRFLPLWNQIDDCLEGQQRIKEKGYTYLPKIGAGDESPENDARNRAYRARAVFHNVTGRTVSNLVGQSFAVPPVYTGPDALLDLIDDVDGAGVTAEQQAKQALAKCVALSRGGLLVDYPKTAGVVTKLQAEEQGVRAKVLFFRAQQIINWRTRARGAKSVLEKVVLEESYIKEDDGFAQTVETQWRVLLLDDANVYTVQLWQKEQAGFVLKDTQTPTQGSGETFDFIPFKFIGAEANNAVCEKPLMLDISNLNLAHYHNSADYEEMVFMTGQATPWASGLTDDWVERHLKGKVSLGSRGLIPLPEGAAIGLLQAQSGTLPKEAMDQKEELMVALGARLVEKREVRRTATEAGQDEASATSSLAGCVSNVSEAYTDALRWAALYQNVAITEPEGTADETESFGYELNQDFAVSRMTPEERNANREDYNADLITFDEARDNLKAGGVAWLDNETAKGEMEAKAEADFAQAQAAFKLQNPGTKPGEAKPPVK
jgi:Domain of unknown function (DUF4055)